ncbi:hypothetical protein K438DRAFT_1789933 [Mycena galopus ATCC 62051]|nr:hypothetical protein K438DRAFT_1789933 [Mycena galopus ATCC 62051]
MTFGHSENGAVGLKQINPCLIGLLLICQNLLPPATSVCRRSCNSFFTSYRNNTVATYAPLRNTTDNTIFMPPFISNRSEAGVRLVFLNTFERRNRPGWWDNNITTEVNARVRATLVTSANFEKGCFVTWDSRPRDFVTWTPRQ